MHRIADDDLASLSIADRIAATCQIEREIARLQARQIRLIASIAAEPCSDAPVPELDREFIKEELRAALGESAVSVGNRIEVARELVGRLTVTLHALEAGELTLRHARLLVEAVAVFDDTAAAVVEGAAVPFAAGRDLAAFARKVRREARKADPRSAE